MTADATDEPAGREDGVARGERSAVGRERDPDEAAGRPGARLLPLGCLMTVAGFFSGAMIAVLVAKVHGWATHCVPVTAELPACDWARFAAVGGVLGAISLPSLVLWRLRAPRWGRRQGERDGGVRDL